MLDLRQIFYVSRMTPGFDDRAVRNVLAMARRKNRMLDITGCLTCTGQHFAQVIEGRESVIGELAELIASDARHTDFKIVMDRPLKLREYPLWSMAYLLNPELADDIEALFSPTMLLRRVMQVMVRLKPDTVMGAL